MACRLFGSFDVTAEVCKVKVHSIAFSWFSNDRKKMILLLFKVLSLVNDKRNSSRPLPPTRKSLKPWIIVQVDIKMETEALFSGDRNINTCTNL